METAGRIGNTPGLRAWYRAPHAAPHMALAEPAARCRRCGMAFRNEALPAALAGHCGRATLSADAGEVEILRCPDCGRRFWADPAGTGGRCAVGMIPEGRP